MSVFTFGDFVFDESAYELRCAGEVVKVDPKVLDLLGFLLRRTGQLVTRSEIIEGVWEGRALSESVLSGAMWSLRKTLGSGSRGEYVTTVYGKGYRFTAAVEVSNSYPTLPPAAPTLLPPTAEEAFLVGRAAELGRALSHVAALRAGRGGLVAISGEPGIGKTRLSEALTRSCEAEGMAVVWSHCRVESLAPPFWPLLQFLRTLVRRGVVGEDEKEVTELLAELMATTAPPAPSDSPVTRGADGGADDSHPVLDRIQQAISVACQVGPPRVLVIDDVQWADAATHKMLAYLLPELPHLRLLVVLTLRTDADTGTIPAALLGHRNCEHIPLHRLSERAVSEYVAQTLGPTGAQVSAAVFKRSEGNPFFMVELLRSFQQSDAVPDAGELSITGPALDIVRVRLKPLASETRYPLTSAAVLGREFDLGVLAAVAQLPTASCMAALDEAGRVGLLRPGTNDEGRFEFGHELVRSVLLENLGSGDRALLHKRAAEVLEQRFPVGEGVPRSELVEHWLAAVPLVPAERPVTHALRLSEHFSYLRSHEDALSVLTKALAALNADGESQPRLRCQVLLTLASSERLCAKPSFLQHFDDAVALARAHGFADVLSMAGQRLSYAPGFIHHPDTHAILVAAAKLLPEDSKAERAKVLAHLSWTPPTNFDGQRVAELAAEAERLASESGDTVAQVEALAARLQLQSGPDHSESAEPIVRRLEALLEGRTKLFRDSWLSQLAFTRLIMALSSGDVSAAQQALVAYGDAARVAKHVELLWHSERACLIMRMNLGQWQGVAEALSALYARAERMRLFSFSAVRSTDMQALETIASPALEPGRARRLPTIYPSDSPNRKAYKIWRIAELGASERVIVALDQHFPQAILAALPHDRDYLGTLSSLVNAVAAVGSAEHARHLLPLLLPHADRFAADVSMLCRGSVQHFLGLLHLVLGNRQDATASLSAAAVANRRVGYVTRALYSEYELARHLMRRPTAADRRQAEQLVAGLRQQATEDGLVRLLSLIESAFGAPPPG